MQISKEFVAFAAFAAEIAFYVLMSLNIASLAIIAERATYFWRRRIDADLLTRQVLHFLKLKDIARARAVLARLPAPECTVLLAGLSEVERGADAAGEAMRSALVRERMRMQTNLTMLKAVAFAAPTLGALGTLLGLLSVMPHLAVPLVNAQGLVGTAVREGLGSLAVAAAGLMVGIPAAVASLLFSRRIQLTEDRCAVLTHLTLAVVGHVYSPQQRAADAAAATASSTELSSKLEATKSESAKSELAKSDAIKPAPPKPAVPPTVEAAPPASPPTYSSLIVSSPAFSPDTLAALKQQGKVRQNRRGKAA